ncbi:MAG: SEC-C metal-binding domain-containing protein, partial [Anaeroplasmataceae bacterium]
QAIADEFNTKYFGPHSIDATALQELDEKEIVDYIYSIALEKLNEKKNTFPEEVYTHFLTFMILKVIDSFWTKHIDKMSALRQGIGLQSYGQGNPLQLYQNEGRMLFNKMTTDINLDVLKFVIRAQIKIEKPETEDKIITNQAEDTSLKTKKKVIPQADNKAKLGRNDLCHCGSGKKFKYCHGR